MKVKIYLLTIIVLFCFSCKDKNVNTEQNTIPLDTTIQKIARNGAFSILEELDQELEQLNESVKHTVSNFIDSIRAGKESVSNLVYYPLERKYPLPPVKNKQDFLDRYEDIFDSKLQQEIINSNPLTDWSGMGFNGIMLHNGTLWIDYDGMLFRLNYQSEKESRMRKKIIEAERKTLHESIQAYEQPILIMETSTYKIRIDDLGNENYRYASWKLDNKINDKPDLILTDGSILAYGSGGNHAYIFTNGNFRYECGIWLMRQKGDNSPASLSVYENEEVILRQNALNLKILRWLIRLH